MNIVCCGTQLTPMPASAQRSVPRRAVSSSSSAATVTSMSTSTSMTSMANHPDPMASLPSWRLLETRNVSDAALYPFLLRLAVMLYRSQPKFRSGEMAKVQSNSSTLALPTTKLHSRSSSFQDMLSLTQSNSSVNSVSPVPPSFGDSKLPKEVHKLLLHRFKGIAVKSDKYRVDDPLLKRSYLSFYAVLLSPDHQKSFKESRRAEDLIMMFMSCAAKELNKAAIEHGQARTLLDKQAAEFVSLLLSLINNNGLAKECPSLISQLNSYVSALESSTVALAPKTNSDGSRPVVLPTFDYNDMQLAKDIGRLLLVANSELQRDIDSIKDKATVQLLISELRAEERDLRDYNRHSVYKIIDFASSADFESWKNSELAAISQVTDSYYRTLGSGVSPVSESNRMMGEDLFYIPNDPASYFKHLLHRCLERDLKDNDREAAVNPQHITFLISKASMELLTRTGNIWRIPASTRGLILLQVALDLYQESTFSLDQLLDAFNTARSIATEHGKIQWDPNSMPSCDKALFLTTLSKIQHHMLEKIDDTLLHIFDPSPPKIGPYLQVLDEEVFPNAAELRYADPLEPELKQLKKLKATLLLAAERKYDALIDDIPRDHTLDPLHIIDLADKLIGIAKKLQKKYPMALFDSISIGHVCSERHLTLFSADSKSMFMHLMSHFKARNEEPAFDEMMLLYKKLAEIRDLFLQVSELAFGFKLEDSFRPFIYQWAESSAELAQTWVDPAIAADSFTPVGEEDDLMFSTSVTDMLTSFNGAMSVLRDLDWRDQFDLAKLYTIIMKGISGSICHYASSLFVLFAAELHAGEEPQVQIKSRQEKWLQMAKAAVNGKEIIVPYKFMKETCVKLNDIERMQVELDKLEGEINSEKMARIIEKKESIPKTSSYLFTVKIIQAEGLKACDMNGLSDPYVTLMDQVSRKTVGKTRTIYEDLNPVWNETFEMATTGPKWLTATIWDENSISNHDLCGRAFIRLDPHAFNNYGSQDYWLDLDTQGRILINISMDSERDDIRFHFGKAFRTLARTEADMIRMIVEKFTAFIKYSISPQTLRSLRGGKFGMEAVSNWLSNTRISGAAGALSAAMQKNQNTRLTPEEIEDFLNPLFDYLNDNFAILARGLTEELKIKVMTQTWKVILQTIEGMLLPPLSSKRTPQQQLNSNEADIVFTWLGALKDFFHHDGAGPSMEILQSQKYQLLVTIPVYYDLSTPELKKESEKMSSMSFKSMQDKTRYAIPELIQRSNTVMAHRNRTVQKQQKEKLKHAMRDLPQTEDIILRILRSRGEYEYVSRRLHQRERMAQTLATETLVKEAAFSRS